MATHTAVRSHLSRLGVWLALGVLLLFGIGRAPNVQAEDNEFDKPQIQLDSDRGLQYFYSQVNTYTQKTLPSKHTDAPSFTMFSVKNSGDTPILYMNKKGYDQLPVKRKQEVLRITYDALNASEMNNRDRNRIFNWLETVDSINSTVVKEFSHTTSTDLYGAAKILAPFQGAMGIVLGVLAITIALLLTFSFVWDMAFLTIPFFTALLSRNGAPSMSNRPFLVSQDAILAYEQTSASGEQVLPRWLRLRSKSVLIVGLCLTYLVSNQIWQLIAFLVEVISRFIS